jgi:cellulose synthase/poly-beta-1,6-N-acetylglucosamine synthase-like glycosyltransferase
MAQTIRHLIAPFANKEVDAVCGNVQVGNVKNLLTAFQDVEYVTSQNYDRRAFDALNCISVVPGATGAWKKKAVLRVSGYSGDTLTEDADLTLTLLEHGGQIVYVPSAKSTTEAPEKPNALFKQRFRWSFGTFQCLWKHRKSFGRGNLGWIALPNMLVFQVIFPLISPIGDLVFLLCLIRGDLKTILMG